MVPEPMLQLLDIIGQDPAVARLQQAMAGSRMPHAFLFAGPAGVGRRTTAAALAACLLCESPAVRPNDGRLPECDQALTLRQACGACESCTLLAAGSHPDFHPIYKELARYHDDADVRNRVMQDLGIPVIRSFLLAPAAQAPTRGRAKVFVVLEAELMSQPAQNCLLKTLEEPPPGVTILLIARRPEQLLPTTRSRCHLIRFRYLPHDWVRDRLIDANVDPTEAAFWAAQTGGSVGRALRMAQQGLHAVKTDLIERIADLDAAGDATLGDHLAKTTDTLSAAAVRAAKQENDAELAKTLATRQATGAVLELIAGAFRDALTVATGADRPLINSDQPESVRRLASRLTPGQLAEVLEQLGRYERLLWRNANAKVLWDNVVITAASAAPLRL